MSRIQGVFANLKAEKRKALIPYVAAGDPNPEITVDLMHAMVDAGADIIELGIPFSDPMADGPVIQRASERALVHAISLPDVLEMVKQFRQSNQNTPIILMGYLNPIEVMGYTNFVQAAKEADIDAVLTVDFPPEESREFVAMMAEQELDPIYLLSPTTTLERMKLICSMASGFVYYVAVKGVTGSSALDTDEVARRFEMIRQVTDLPVGVGFGIKDAVTASAIGQFSDAVIVGSALVKIVEENVGDNALTIKLISELLSSMRKALDEL